MTKTTVSSKAVRSALVRLAQAIENVQRQATNVRKEAEGVLKDLEEGRRPSYGYSNQSLIQAATSLATLEACTNAAVAFCDTDNDLEALDYIFANPGDIWDLDIEGGDAIRNVLDESPC